MDAIESDLSSILASYSQMLGIRQLETRTQPSKNDFAVSENENRGPRSRSQALQAQEETLDKFKISYTKRAKANPNKTLEQLGESLVKTILRETLAQDEELGIRDCFQVTLIAAIVLFIAFDLLSLAILLR